MAIVVFGARGQARVLLELMHRLGMAPLAGLLDDDPALGGTKVDGMPILGPMDQLPNLARIHQIHRAVIAIGDNRARQRLGNLARSLGLQLPALIHPDARVSPTATLGAGSVVLAGAVVGVHARIGELAIINTHATVDHECDLGDSVHVAPGATLTGRVTVGAGTLIGAGATIIPGICVGKNSIVGAGATVIRDVSANTTVVGCPARAVTKRQ